MLQSTQSMVTAGGQADPVLAEEKGAGADGEKRHRRGTVEVGDHGVQVVLRCGALVTDPVEDRRDCECHEQDTCDRPHATVGSGSKTRELDGK